jgi:hypothetical protein
MRGEGRRGKGFKTEVVHFEPVLIQEIQPPGWIRTVDENAEFGPSVTLSRAPPSWLTFD